MFGEKSWHLITRGIGSFMNDLVNQLDYRISGRVPYSNASLRQDIRRLCAIWRQVQASRDRDAIYDYLVAVYEIVAWWRVEGRVVGRARRALRIVSSKPTEDPFVAVIAASVAPARLDRRQLSKYSRVLRFALRLECHPSQFKRFVKDRCGGLNACAERFSRRASGDEEQVVEISANCRK